MPQTVTALIVAAGESRRAGGDVPKQYQLLEHKSLLRRSAEAFLAHPAVTRVGVVVHPGHAQYYARHTEGLALLPPIAGGKTRQESVLLGLEWLAANQPPDLVLIHDAARPNITPDVITRVIEGLARQEAVVPALPVYDTLKHVEDEAVVGTIERAKLFRAQTPQGFRFPSILEAHRSCRDVACTDDAAVAEHAGLAVGIVAGSEHNYKITTREDMQDAQALLAAMQETHVGMGIDAHRLIPGDGSMMLCGVAIPSLLSLEGHSDADVGLHALVDALLGAMAEGDIGQHFPPTDARWKGADSGQFVRHAVQLLRERGGQLQHVDVTLVCEQPKLAPHRDAMRNRIAALMDILPARVSVKATTTERMGFTGRGEGIVAQAAVTLRLPALQAKAA